MRSMTFIDGSNFYKGIKNLLNDNTYSLLHFQYDRFLQWLIAESTLVEARYYIGGIKRDNRDPKSQLLYSNQQRLIAYLQKYKIPVTLGNIIRHPDGSFHEKGVDVRIAVEMIRFARSDSYDQVLLISSDTDLVPAVEEVIQLGKKVVYIGFPANQSFGLTKASSHYLILRKEDIETFFPPRLNLKM